MTSPGRRLIPMLAIVAIAAVVVSLVVLLGGNDGRDKGVSAGGEPVPSPYGTFGGSVVPADIKVEGTKRLRDGGLVKVRVTSKDGAEIYGFEAFLCAGGASFELDADVRPDLTGNCASNPLSVGSDRYKQVKALPPYEVVESTFVAGVGTDSYTTVDGVPVTITCGPGHPCQLVLKVQYPNGYGFRSFSLDYA